MLRSHIVGASCAVLAIYGWAGCLERQAGRLAGDVDIADTTGDGATSDTTTDTSDTFVRPDTSGDDVVVCDPGTTLSRQGEVVFDDTGMSFTPVKLDGTTLHGTRRRMNADGSGGQRNLVAIDVASGAERVLVEGSDDQSLLDARDEVVLYAATSADQATMTLRYRDLRGRDDKVLFKGEVNGPTRVMPGTFVLERMTRLVERGAAVWGEQTDAFTPQAKARVRLFRDGEIATLFEETTSIDVPELRNGRVLWLTWGEARTLWLAARDQPPTAIARGNIEDSALGDDAAWWLEGGAVMRHDFASGENRRVHAGPCGLLVADGRQAAAVCGPTSGDDYIMRAGEPFVFDRDHAFPIASQGGDGIAGLRLFEGRIAWVEYPAGVGCSGSGDETGELVIASIARPDVSHIATTVLAGCWCCGAYWPPLQLSLSAAAIAWNYPRPATTTEPFYPNRDAVGWGLFAVPVCR